MNEKNFLFINFFLYLFYELLLYFIVFYCCNFWGDLFEKFEDIENSNIWLDAGSEDPNQQKKNRSKIANIADWIVPGHGPKFKVTDEIRQTLAKQIV